MKQSVARTMCLMLLGLMAGCGDSQSEKAKAESDAELQRLKGENEQLRLRNEKLAVEQTQEVVRITLTGDSNGYDWQKADYDNKINVCRVYAAKLNSELSAKNSSTIASIMKGRVTPEFLCKIIDALYASNESVVLKKRIADVESEALSVMEKTAASEIREQHTDLTTSKAAEPPTDDGVSFHFKSGATFVGNIISLPDGDTILVKYKEDGKSYTLHISDLTEQSQNQVRWTALFLGRYEITAKDIEVFPEKLEGHGTYLRLQFMELRGGDSYSLTFVATDKNGDYYDYFKVVKDKSDIVNALAKMSRGTQFLACGHYEARRFLLGMWTGETGYYIDTLVFRNSDGSLKAY